MELESESKINREDFCKYYRFITFKIEWIKLIPVYLFTSAIILFILLLLGNIHQVDYSVVMLIIIFVALFIFMMIVFWFSSPNKEYDLKKLYSFNYYFIWKNNCFTVKTTTYGITSTSDITYTSLIKVLEVNDYIYIFVSKSSAYLIPKNSFAKGSWIELSNILKSNLVDKYRTYH